MVTIQAINVHACHVGRYGRLSIQTDTKIPTKTGKLIQFYMFIVASCDPQRDAKAAERTHEKMCEERLAVS